MMDYDLPTNVKQIGSITDGVKIYIEDYVYSYLQQYTEAFANEEKLAFLLGRSMLIDGQIILFISGAVAGKFCRHEGGVLKFTEASVEYAKEMIEKYFSLYEVVGFMQSQPGYGVFLNSAYAAYHDEKFKSESNVLFVVDPVEKVNTFYVYKKGESGELELTEARGYFIYYDKNKEMHEYMLENKTVDIVSKKPDIPLKEQDEPDKPAETRDGRESRDSKETPESVMRRHFVERSLKKSTDHKRVVNLLASLSAVLLIICIIMGTGMIQNEGRISQLESQITSISTSYKNLLVQFRQDNVAEVFAASGDQDRTAGTQPQSTAPQPTSPQPPQATMQPAQQTPKAVTPTAPSAPTAPSMQQPQLTAQPSQNTQPSQSLQPIQTTTQPTGGVQPQPEPQPVQPPNPLLAPTPQPDATPAVTQAPQAGTGLDSSVYVNLSTIPDTYIVQKGDNLLYISMKFYGTSKMVDKIMEVNGLTNPDKIFFGKVLKLPR